jgi:predicted DNA-binding protein (MmcQ/YjbR family)
MNPKFTKVNIEQIHNYATSLANVEETQPFGPDNIVYKVSNKMFLLLATDAIPLCFNVKCNPELAIELREKYNTITAGYHMNKKHWNTITIDGSLSAKQLKEFIEHSYNLVKGKNK